jgi:predicted secreted protein
MFKHLLSATVLSAALLVVPSAFAAEEQYGYVTVDATVYHAATPDVVILNATCSTLTGASRDATRTELRQWVENAKTMAGTQATVRKTSGYYLTPYYDYTDPNTSYSKVPTQFTGSVSFSVSGLKGEAVQKVVEGLEDQGCTTTWDVRATHTASYVRENKKELMDQINERKEVFEDLLGMKLTKITNLSYYSSANYTSNYNYGSGIDYDPETNMVQMTTTLSVTYGYDLAK